ncbi:MAG: glycoside hydrolase family 9 protein [Mangrovibacterium sp.]
MENRNPLHPGWRPIQPGHYQWYPFINLGHYYLAYEYQNRDQNLFDEYFRKGMDQVYERGKNNPFLFGVPFIWCSNNLVVAIATQCNLYRKATNDNRYREMEQSLVDWLFGCNPWGTSMIIGIPEKGDFPSDSHAGCLFIF